MTNKITLSRELVEQIHKELTSGSVSIGTGAQVRAALASQHVVCSAGILCQNRECKECGGNGSYIPPLADPVPPAGGEPEGYKYRLKGRVNRAWTYAKDKPEQFTDEFDVVPLYSGDIVTRLQAEVERLVSYTPTPENTNRLPEGIRQYVSSLQTLCDPSGVVAENTLLRDQTKQLDAMIGRLKSELTKAREQAMWMRRELNALVPDGYTNPDWPAPADKGQGDAVAIGSLRRDANERILFDAVGDPHIKDGMPVYAEQPAPVAVVPEKYDDVLLPFLSLMRAELHANARKGDRPGWLQMDRKTAVLEVFYHMGKLHMAVHRNDKACIKEYAADVANMCMMLTDVCGCLDSEPKP